jgi:hypothetical protein
MLESEIGDNDVCEQLAMETDYAVFADESTCDINKADAAAFFYEGYKYALKRLNKFIEEE